MRIIKLNISEIPDENINSFFNKVLPERNGEFRITKGRIHKDKFSANEKLVFSYKGKICYTAKSLSKIQKNTDNTLNKKYPYYFVIDTSTIKPIDMDIHLFEKEYHNFSHDTKSIARTQGWPYIKDDKIENLLWKKLND